MQNLGQFIILLLLSNERLSRDEGGSRGHRNGLSWIIKRTAIKNSDTIRVPGGGWKLTDLGVCLARKRRSRWRGAIKFRGVRACLYGRCKMPSATPSHSAAVKPTLNGRAGRARGLVCIKLIEKTGLAQCTARPPVEHWTVFSHYHRWDPSRDHSAFLS